MAGIFAMIGNRNQFFKPSPPDRALAHMTDAMLLMAGYTIECLLKCIIASRRPEYFAAGRVPNTHFLRPLAELAQLQDELSAEDFALLDLLTEYILITGRYMTGTTAARTHRQGTVQEAAYTQFVDLKSRLDALAGTMIGPAPQAAADT